jgi:hypothetical protein
VRTQSPLPKHEDHGGDGKRPFEKTLPIWVICSWQACSQFCGKTERNIRLRASMPDSICANLYDPLPAYDEMFASPGELRTHYGSCAIISNNDGRNVCRASSCHRCGVFVPGDYIEHSLDRNKASSGFFHSIWSRALSHARNGISLNAA